MGESNADLPEHVLSERRAARRRRIRKALRIVACIAVAAVLIAVIGLVVVDQMGRAARRRVLGELRARGLATSIRELSPEVQRDLSDDGLPVAEALQSAGLGPDGEGKSPTLDGAPYYLAAFELATYPREWIADLPYVGFAYEPALCEPISAEFAGKMEAYLRLNEDFFTLVNKGRRFTHFDYDLTRGVKESNSRLDTIAGSLKHVTGPLGILCLHHQASDRGDDALDACAAMLDASRSFDGEPWTFLWYNRAAVGCKAADGLQQTLSRTTPSAAALDGLHARFVHEAEAIDRGATLAAEIAWVAEDMQHVKLMLARSEVQYQAFLLAGGFAQMRELEEVTGKKLGWSERRLRLVHWFNRHLSWLFPGAYAGNRARTIELLLEYYDDASLPPHEQASRIKEFLRPPGEVLVDQAKASISRLVSALIEHEAQMRVAAAAIDLERYRLEHGRWPVQLADLPGGAPTDPFTGTALTYRPTTEGCTLYSVGKNRGDDLGEGDRYAIEPGPDDIAFRLFDVDRRNRPQATSGVQ